MIFKTSIPESTRVVPVASRRSRHSALHAPMPSLTSAAFPRRPQAILRAFIPKIQGIVDGKSASPSDDASHTASAGKGPVLAITDGSLATPSSTKETKQVIIGRHYGTVIGHPKDKRATQMAFAGTGPFPADGMTCDEIQSAIECGVGMVELFSTDTDNGSYQAYAAAQVQYSQRIRAAQFSGLPGAQAVMMRLDARKTAFERGFITTLGVPPTLIPSASRQAVGITARSTSTTTIPESTASPESSATSGVDTTTGFGNTIAFGHSRPRNVSTRVDVRPVKKIAAPRTRSVSHNSTQSRAVSYSKKDHLQYLGMIDQLESANKEPEISDSKGPKTSFAQQFARLVLATNSVVYPVVVQTGSILKDLLRQSLRIAIGFIVMSALWLVPNVGAELTCIFLIIIFFGQ